MAIRQFPVAGIPGGFQIQPGSELVYHDTGLIEGTVTMKAVDDGRAGRLRDMIGTRHPEDGDVFLYALRNRALTLAVNEGTFDCIGTVGAADTDRIVVPVPSKEMLPIEAHPKFFTADMAGPEAAITALGGAGSGFAEGANGARFSVTQSGNKITGFLGFLGTGAPANLRPARFYERNTPVLRATWYSWADPTFQFKSVIVNNPKGAPNTGGVKNWLRSAPVGERVGAANGFTLWKMTQEYVGSETGWNDVVYDTVTE